MSESERSQTGTLETRLAQMDRRLRDIQAELLPEHEPPPEHEPAPEPPPAPGPPPASEPEPGPAAPTPLRPREPDEPPPPAPREPQPPVPPEPPPEPEPQPIPPAAGSPAGAEARGRSGPLASLLQRARREPSSQQFELLADLCARLLASLRELLGGYEAVVSQARPATPEAPPSTEPPLTAERPAAVSVSAGPFDSTVALREFERAMASLPGVREVAVRGYEGADRAILHVELDERP